MSTMHFTVVREKEKTMIMNKLQVGESNHWSHRTGLLIMKSIALPKDMHRNGKTVLGKHFKNGRKKSPFFSVF